MKMFSFKTKPWERFITAQNEKLVDKKGIALLDEMLKVDHSLRITAHEALRHPFFEDCRDFSQ